MWEPIVRPVIRFDLIISTSFPSVFSLSSQQSLFYFVYVDRYFYIYAKLKIKGQIKKTDATIYIVWFRIHSMSLREVG